MTNPFEEVAASASRPTQEKMARAPTTAMEKDRYNKAKQLQLFKQWKREIRQGLAEGIYGPEIVQLLRLLRRIPDEEVLIRFVQQSKWLQEATLEVRYNILSYISSAMMRWNIRHGLAPFNDSLPDQPDSPFIIIRKLLVFDHDQYHRGSK